MKRWYNFIISTILFSVFLSCRQNDSKPAFHQLEGGANVAIHENGNGEPVQPGNWLKMEVTQLYNDSVLRDSKQTGPEYHRYDSASMTPASLIAFKNIKEGDSLEFKAPDDSVFVSGRPSFAQHKKGFLITRVKIAKIIRSEEEYKKEFPADSINEQ